MRCGTHKSSQMLNAAHKIERLANATPIYLHAVDRHTQLSNGNKPNIKEKRHKHFIRHLNERQQNTFAISIRAILNCLVENMSVNTGTADFRYKNIKNDDDDDDDIFFNGKCRLFLGN